MSSDTTYLYEYWREGLDTADRHGYDANDIEAARAEIGDDGVETALALSDILHTVEAVGGDVEILGAAVEAAQRQFSLRWSERQMRAVAERYVTSYENWSDCGRQYVATRWPDYPLEHVARPDLLGSGSLTPDQFAVRPDDTDPVHIFTWVEHRR